MSSPGTIYTAANCAPAYQLRWSLFVFTRKHVGTFGEYDMGAIWRKIMAFKKGETAAP